MPAPPGRYPPPTVPVTSPVRVSMRDMVASPEFATRSPRPATARSAGRRPPRSSLMTRPLSVVQAPHRVVVPVRHPDSARSDDDRRRSVAHLDRADDVVRRRVDLRDGPVAAVRHPDETGADRHRLRAGSHVDRLGHGTGSVDRCGSRWSPGGSSPIPRRRPSRPASGLHPRAPRARPDPLPGSITATEAEANSGGAASGVPSRPTAPAPAVTNARATTATVTCRRLERRQLPPSGESRQLPRRTPRPRIALGLAARWLARSVRRQLEGRSLLEDCLVDPLQSRPGVHAQLGPPARRGPAGRPTAPRPAAPTGRAPASRSPAGAPAAARARSTPRTQRRRSRAAPVRGRRRAWPPRRPAQLLQPRGLRPHEGVRRQVVQHR